MALTTPVVFIIFNRADTTRRVFEQIERARPRQLTIIADGPRPGNPDDPERCRMTRKVVEHISWECEVVRDYSDDNLGMLERFTTGFGRAFERYDEAIILEDDCLPDPGFFEYCQEMLRRYRDDHRVKTIAGCNLVGEIEGPGDYFFTRFVNIWGWATWKRTWNEYEPSMERWNDPAARRRFERTIGNPHHRRILSDLFEKTYRGEIITWDYPLIYSILRRDGYSIMPRRNLIENIGFRPDAIHTTDENHALGHLPRLSLSAPFSSPGRVRSDRRLDERLFNTVIPVPPYQPERSIRKVVRRLKRGVARLVNGLIP